MYHTGRNLKEFNKEASNCRRQHTCKTGKRFELTRVEESFSAKDPEHDTRSLILCFHLCPAFAFSVEAGAN